ncbi:hypothetical protein HFU84_12105 [Acidithiobacillus sp. CV18-2]|nr:hypothetical protein [Acidithiobacillus sp. CV18-3]MBU2758345.1 hypothetical protein [Acidithiobacillus sp. BN09-2]MBU2778230.1 hypothetical protein [Acidithiobacillus sp. CV18-2]MBU2799103.1 hypothetical protein [Acidithiobacillus sp. VAN18-4]
MVGTEDFDDPFAGTEGAKDELESALDRMSESRAREVGKAVVRYHIDPNDPAIALLNLALDAERMAQAAAQAAAAAAQASQAVDRRLSQIGGIIQQNAIRAGGEIGDETASRIRKDFVQLHDAHVADLKKQISRFREHIVEGGNKMIENYLSQITVNANHAIQKIAEEGDKRVQYVEHYTLKSLESEIHDTFSKYMREVEHEDGRRRRLWLWTEALSLIGIGLMLGVLGNFVVLKNIEHVVSPMPILETQNGQLACYSANHGQEAYCEIHRFPKKQTTK